jgi:hypothetical protein
MNMGRLPRLPRALAAAILILAAVSFAAPALAALPSIVPECARQTMVPGGSAPPVPSLNCFFQAVGNVVLLLLGISGAIALFMFVWGGFDMVTAFGRSDKVESGKKKIVAALIGIAIIATSGMLVRYGLSKIGLASTTQVIGTKCGTNGTYVQKEDGTIACATACDSGSLGSANYKCMTDTQAAGYYCIGGLCKDAKTPNCCYTGTGSSGGASGGSSSK